MPATDVQSDLPTRRLASPPAMLAVTDAPKRRATQFGSDSSWNARAPRSPDGYEILGVLGRGGMGTVYQARQISLNRIVALKMISAGNLASVEECERFYREAEAVARLQHPNIVQIHEIGQVEGVPYFSLEYVEGGTLGQFLDRQPQDARVAAELLEPIARGVQHAHENAIVHRDLKPANVLVSMDGRHWAADCQKTPNNGHDAKNDGSARPSNPRRQLPTAKITDFGLARHLDDSVRLTQTGYAAGTPPYMAPEHIAANGPVGPSVDIYALGAILYEMLTGRTPFTGGTADVMYQALNSEPVSPRRLQPSIPRDLETICLKCLRKDPRQRYLTARELADELRRFLDGRPISARAIGPMGQARLWCRRNRLATGLLAAIVVALAAGTAVATYFAIRADRNALSATASADRSREEKRIANDEKFKALQATKDKDRALEEKDLALDSEKKLANLRKMETANAYMVIAQRDWEKGQVARARQILRLYEPVSPNQRDIRGFEWFYLDRLTRSQLYEILSVRGGPIAGSPDGKHFATVQGNVIIIWSALDGQEVHRIQSHQSHISSLDFDKTGKRLVSASHDMTVAVHDVKSGETIRVFKEHKQWVLNARFAPDGQTIVSSGVTTSASSPSPLLLWNANTGEIVRRLQAPGINIQNLAFTPDGKMLFGVNCSVFVNRWDLTTGNQLPVLRFQNAPVCRIALSPPDGRMLAACLVNGTVAVVDAKTGQEIRVFRGTSEIMNAIAFSPDGEFLAFGGNDSVIHYCQVAAGHEVRAFRGAGTAFRDLAFLPGDELRLAATSPSGVKVWNAGVDPERREVEMPEMTGGQVALSSDRQQAAVTSLNGNIFLCKLPEWKVIKTLTARSTGQGIPRGIQFSPDGKFVAVTTFSGTVDFHVVDPNCQVPKDLARPNGSAIMSGAFAADGRRFATGHEDGAIRIHDLQGSEPVEVLAGHARTVASVAFHPRDNNILVSGGFDGSVRFWNIARRQATYVRRDHDGVVNSVAFAPDGAKVVSAGASRLVIAWDTATGTPIYVLDEQADVVTQAIFTPRGDRIAIASVNGSIRLFDVDTGKETLSLRGASGIAVHGMIFCDNERTLAGVGQARTMRLWEAGGESPRERLRALAFACRLEGLTCEKSTDPLNSLRLRSRIVNPTERDQAAPNPNSLGTDAAIAIRTKLIPMSPQSTLGAEPPTFTRRFVPAGPIAAHEWQAVSISLPIENGSLPTGRYRVVQELGWMTNVFNSISETQTEFEMR